MIFVFFIYFLLITICCVYFMLGRDKYTAKEKFGATKNAVVVAAKNEENNIKKLLDDLTCQTLENLEIIIVDDNSTDKTVEIIKKYQNKYPQIKLLSNIGHGKKAALETAISNICVDFVFQTDADCRLSPTWAENILKTALKNDSQMVLAPVILVATNSKSVFQQLWVLESLSLITVTAGTCLAGIPTMSNGANIMYKLNRRKKASLNSKYAGGDDMFLMQDFLKKHKKISYCFDSQVLTTVPKNWHQLLKQRARWVEKSGGYTQFAVIFFALVVFGTNIGLILSFFLGLFGIIGWNNVIIFYLLKTIPDLLSIIAPAVRFKIKVVPWIVFLLSVLYPFYTLAVAIKAFCSKTEWK